MSDRQLKHKPLVEAILEVRWALQPTNGEFAADPHYDVLVGRLFDRLSDRYPFHQALPAAVLPGDVAPHVVRHQFRAACDSWPLVQVGPGVVTLNATEDYAWEDFGERAQELVVKLWDAYPDAAVLRPTLLLLRYMNAVLFEYSSEDALAFLRDNLHLRTELPRELISDHRIADLPRAADLRLSFTSLEPSGRLNLRFGTGRRTESDAVIWELTFSSEETELPAIPAGFRAWAEKAHQLIEDWFFKLIAGDLERRFSGGK